MNVFIMRSLQARARNEIAATVERAAFLRRKLLTVLQEEADILDYLNLAECAQDAVAGYRPMVDGRYKCPCCAVAANDDAELTELQADPGKRRFVCPTCQQDFEFDLQRH